MANVIFKFGKQNQYDTLPKKDYNTLYWIEDTQKLYKGDIQFGFGKPEDIFEKGYYFNGNFYKDQEHFEIINPQKNRIYISIDSSKLYIYDGKQYKEIGNGNGGTIDIPLASETVSGTVKIFNSIGSNEDGTMTQKAITEELNNKIEMDVREEEEMLVLDYDIKKSF